MQQFVVPQFLDVEDKVIGPITVRQFIILLVSGGIEFLAWKFADFALFLILTLLNMLFTILFAFVKINGRPVHFFFLNFIQTAKRPWLRIWHREISQHELRVMAEKKDARPVIETTAKIKIGTSRLAELSLIVDTGGIYSGEGEKK